MAALEELEDMKAVIEEKLSQGLTYVDISRQIQEQYPNVKGFSIRSIERFCASHGLHKTSRLSQHELQKVVTTAVHQVCISGEHIHSLHRSLPKFFSLTIRLI